MRTSEFRPEITTPSNTLHYENLPELHRHMLLLNYKIPEVIVRYSLGAKMMLIENNLYRTDRGKSNKEIPTQKFLQTKEKISHNFLKKSIVQTKKTFHAHLKEESPSTMQKNPNFSHSKKKFLTLSQKKPTFL